MGIRKEILKYILASITVFRIELDPYHYDGIKIHRNVQRSDQG